MGKRSRLEKILYGARHSNKYPATIVMALSLGGCIPMKNLMSISPDGKYLTVGYNQLGEVQGENDIKTEGIAIVNLRNNDVKLIKNEMGIPMWLSNTKNKVAFVEGFNRNETEDSSITIIEKGKKRTIPHAGFPSLSDKGKLLVYTSFDKENPKNMFGDLTLLNLEREESKKLAEKVILGDLSPDNKHVLYVSPIQENLGLYVISIDGKNPKLIAKLDSKLEPGQFSPKWIDKKRIIYRTLTGEDEKDREIFISDLEGKVEQITDNDIEENHVSVTNDGRVVYMGLGEDKERVNAALFVAKKSEGQWRHKPLNINASYFNLTSKNQIVYLIPGTGESSYQICVRNLDKPSKITDLSYFIREEMAKGNK